MFTLDEMIKPKVLAQLTSDTTIHHLLDVYWNQLVLYLLVAPLQWLHMVHILYSTTWDEYSFSGKLFISVYVVLCFALWEVIRIFIFHICRAVRKGGSVVHAAIRAVSKTAKLSQEGLTQVAPMLSDLAKNATEAMSKIGKSPRHRRT